MDLELVLLRSWIPFVICSFQEESSLPGDAKHKDSLIQISKNDWENALRCIDATDLMLTVLLTGASLSFG